MPEASKKKPAIWKLLCGAAPPLIIDVNRFRSPLQSRLGREPNRDVKPGNLKPALPSDGIAADGKNE